MMSSVSACCCLNKLPCRDANRPSLNVDKTYLHNFDEVLQQNHFGFINSKIMSSASHSDLVKRVDCDIYCSDLVQVAHLGKQVNTTSSSS